MRRDSRYSAHGAYGATELGPDVEAVVDHAGKENLFEALCLPFRPCAASHTDAAGAHASTQAQVGKEFLKLLRIEGEELAQLASAGKRVDHR